MTCGGRGVTALPEARGLKSEPRFSNQEKFFAK